MTVKVGSKTGIVIRRVSRDVTGGRGEGEGRAPTIEIRREGIEITEYCGRGGGEYWGRGWEHRRLRDRGGEGRVPKVEIRHPT